MASKKVSGVYSVQNTVTGKRYIGGTKDVIRRWRRHRQLLRKGKHHSLKFQASWNKHGEEAWCWTIIEECTIADLVKREQHYINLFDVFRNGYNISASAGFVNLSDEGKLKVVAGAHKGASVVTGSRWMHHKVSGTKRVLLSGIAEHLTAGWEFGRADKIGKRSPNKGNKYSNESIERLRRSHIGLRWLTHPDFGNKRVRDEAVSQYLNEGWHIGRVSA